MKRPDVVSFRTVHKDEIKKAAKKLKITISEFAEKACIQAIEEVK